MKISYRWLKEYVALDLPPKELAGRLLLMGYEVSELVETGPAFSGVVVAEVRKAEKHPNADRLSVCEVFDGARTWPVVCGAPNVAAGQRIAFARVGASLPGGSIKKAKIRGAVSEGMICSTVELNLPSTPDAEKGIMVLGPDAPPLGTDFAKTLGESDAILNVEIPPNRPDCLSHFGLARELAVNMGLPLTPPKTEAFSEAGPRPLPVEVAEPSECPRYQGRLITGVRVGPSPDWLARRLEAVGLRPINNVVDITNYVLMELGQPLHAFDPDKLEGGRVLVRRARDGEKLLALDGKDYPLSPENLVIADASRPVAVAGVMGGELTGIDAKTTSVFVECAFFRPGRVRLSARRLGLNTDSSYRFERGADPGGLNAASARAASLILSLCGGTAGPVSDTQPSPEPKTPIRVSASRINRLLGTRVPEDRIETLLGRLAARTEGAGEGFTVHVPSWRHDLECPADLAEEVARHLDRGYDDIPTEIAAVRLPLPETPRFVKDLGSLRGSLCGLGFQEALNYDFISAPEYERFFGAAPAESAPRLSNPVSEDWVFLRPSLLVGLLRNAALNSNRGADGVRLFESGKTYEKRGPAVGETLRLAGLMAGICPARPNWSSPGEEPDFYALKGAVETLLRDFGAVWAGPSADAAFHPKAALELKLADGKTVGRAGLLHPELLRRWGLRFKTAAAFELDLEALGARPARTSRFAPYSPFPDSWRDLSLLVDGSVLWSAVDGAIRGLGLPSLGRVDLIDVFEGKPSRGGASLSGDGAPGHREGGSPGAAALPDGKKSLTLRLTFSLMDRTLRDEEVQESVDRILASLKERCGAELRA